MQILLCTLLIFISQCQGFFKNSSLQLNTTTNRYNLTCISNFNDGDLFTNCEYCVYEFFSNGTDSTIYYDCIYLTNSYRRVTQRCTGFSDRSDIGYGLCSKLPFEYFDIDLLCICATDLCNENFTTCRQSVDANPNLPSLSSSIPLLIKESSSITCQDTPVGILNSTYYCVRDSTPYINMTQCEEYVQNHTVLCMYLESNNGNYLTLVALPDEDYEYVLVDQIQFIQKMAVQSNVKQYYNETPNTFYIQWKETLEDNNYTIIYNKCYCMTNDCNVNLTACLQAKTPINKFYRNTSNILLVFILTDFIMMMNFLKLTLNY
ncbi:unnamed protein product [Rotaria sordida]|uniref:Uncharacterized protein n=1 Tax=Rotaria sordida TaxID=392033 RepID=A0A815HSB1_9BILA|nr:unnamed protein product [Rotaria sordida]